MAGTSIRKYVGQKVAVVRWKPPATHYGDTDTFLAGTWDDEEGTGEADDTVLPGGVDASPCQQGGQVTGGDVQGEELRMWRYTVGVEARTLQQKVFNSLKRRSCTRVRGLTEAVQENSVGVWRIPESEDDPVPVFHLPHQGDVSDIQYVTRDSFIVGSGLGSVRLCRHTAEDALETVHCWDKVHSFTTGPAPCTSLACSGEQIASVGEDGKLIILHPNQKKPTRVLEGVGGCSLYAVMFVRTHEVLTSSMQGHLKLWDLRASSPAKGLLFSPDQVAVCYLAGHPTQQHLVAAGGEDGTLALWDMRNTAHPFTIIAAHTGPICQVQFHPMAPEHLFTSGMDGQLLHWDASGSAKPIHMSHKAAQDVSGGSVTVWLGSEVSRGATDTTSILQSPLPINSLDVEGPTLIAGSDSEAIYVLSDVLKKRNDSMVY
ncbi:Nucleoporin Nup43 [Chionoecetes opilio]|uniref:Nucleoporin Nup43 n=1 Tax=Chionoecetes opilio TaxID=41210 RepID=A0A8J4Y2I4_CHIOP|nr:Nucleoporin Nup43 [Chionoecetes opilio]